MAESTADRIRSALAEAPARRYPAVLVVLPPNMEEGVAVPDDVHGGLACLDCVAAAQDDSAFLRASYLWRTFLDHLREQAATRGCLFVRDVDAVVARWPQPDRDVFFGALVTLECRRPGSSESALILLCSHLAAATGLRPRTHGQAVVLDLTVEE